MVMTFFSKHPNIMSATRAGVGRGPMRASVLGGPFRPIFGMVVLAVAAAASAAPAAETMDTATYDRAARFLSENAENMAPNARVRPHWRLGGRERFTYRRELGEGRADFVEVDAESGRKTPAFDAAVVAKGLAPLLQKSVDPFRLPFKDYEEEAGGVRVTVDGTDYLCQRKSASCAVAAPAQNPLEIASPDGHWLAFVKDYNLWVRAAAGGDPIQLTADGAPHDAYGASLEVSPEAVTAKVAGKPIPPVLLWSPDSRRILVQKIDERKVAEVTIVRSTPLDGTQRPTATSFRYALPGDPDLSMSEEWVFDVATRQGQRVKLDPIPQLYITTLQSREAWWSADGAKLYLFARPRFYKSMTLYEVDPKSGDARQVVTESGRTFVEPANNGQRPMIYTLKSGQVIWFSERDGQGGLYLLDGQTGAVIRPLAPGPGVTFSVVRLDEKRGALYASISGREPGSDPYLHKIYKIDLANGQARLLTPEDADHDVFGLQQRVDDPPGTTAATAVLREDFSPSGRYFLDNYTRADLPTRTVLRRADGALVAEIERADVSRLEALGVTTPERFQALAADGVTPLYGVILRPSRLDPHKSYPVVDSPYPGPQTNRVRPKYLDLMFDRPGAQSVAELGFVVVLVDGRGTPGRGKTFTDESYGGLGQAGHLDDHVAVIKQLKTRYPYMDLDHVGIFGTSGGGYAAAHALFLYPDFYKVGVSDAGNHDQRGYIAVWGETYNGARAKSPGDTDVYASSANPLLVKGLKGKLLLMHGDMDTNVLPDQTLQLANALIKANKDFDLLIVPNAGHGAMRIPYARRRTWDYLVKNLMGVDPPYQYDLESKVPKP
jgi:dipeptidyl aminopeptidase/acylaminoacyl peptidase